jgi:hypothetical protein
MLSRICRTLRVSRRRALTARRAWVHRSIDATLPEAVADRVPGWARTSRGRIVLALIALVALLGWAEAFVLLLL